MPTRLAGALLTLLLILVAGCQPVPPPATPTATPVPLPTPSATVAPTLTAAPPATQPAPTAPPPTAPPTTAPTAPTAGVVTPSAALPLPPGSVAGLPSLGDPKAPELGNTGYDVDQYTLRLKLDLSGKQLAGSAIIDATTTFDRLGQFSLDFVDGMTVQGLRVDGAGVPYAYQNDKLVVNLPRPYRQGERFTLVVDYSGPIRPIASRFASFAKLGLQVLDDGTAFAFSEPDGSRAWFPCNDHPLDKARFRFEISVPPGQVVASNGVLRETRDTPDGTLYVWEMAQPMATYLATVMIAPYERLEGRTPSGIPLRHYVFPQRQADAERLYATTGEALDWFAQRLGPYPFDQFGYTMVGLRGASLETQSNVLMSDRMLNENVLVHEMAHMWFGDTVSLSSWDDIWRNEGFATYFATLWERRNDDPAALVRTMNALETQLNAHPTTYPLGDPPPAQLFGQDSYLKGAWVAHMLRLQVGDEAFFRALRTYFERYRGRAAGRAEFEAVFSEVSGQNLAPFFQRWLDQPGVPGLDVTWVTSRVDGQYSLDVQVCQTNGLPYPQDLDLVAGSDTGSAPLRIPLNGAPRATFSIPFAPTSLATDPDEHLLANENAGAVERLEPCQ